MRQSPSRPGSDELSIEDEVPVIFTVWCNSIAHMLPRFVHYDDSALPLPEGTARKALPYAIRSDSSVVQRRT